MISFDHLELLLYRIFGGLFVAFFALMLFADGALSASILTFALVPVFFIFWTTCAVCAAARIFFALIGWRSEHDMVDAILLLVIILVLSGVFMGMVYSPKG